MTHPIPRLLLIAAAALLVGCVSNPTPYPQDQDGKLSSDTTPTSPPATRDRDEVCEDLGGTWRDDDDLCVALGEEFDAGAGAPDAGDPPRADIVELYVHGEPGAYSFTVMITSDDTGCDGYADWWEIVDFAGTLLHRELLDGPRPDLQVRESTAGPLALDADTRVVVRAHRHPEGYRGDALVGTAAGGFTVARLASSFAASLATEPPQPAPCAPPAR